jgi:hypothetical protein
MPALKVAIVRVVDEGQPGSVECRFADADGREHVIVLVRNRNQQPAMDVITQYRKHMPANKAVSA